VRVIISLSLLIIPYVLAFIYAYPIMFTSKDVWFALESRYNITNGHPDAPQVGKVYLLLVYL
jgi:hypothetical protein